MSLAHQLLATLLVLPCLVACGEDDTTQGSGGSTGSSGGSGGSAATGGAGGALPFALTSSAFAEGETIPTTYECGPPLIPDGLGDNVSPPLDWTAGPAQTQSYALVMRDVDAGSLVHWVVYDIPMAVRALPEGIPEGYLVSAPAGAKQAELQGVIHAYLGPCSPSSVNTYQLVLHALDVAELAGVQMSTPETDVAALIESTAIASASLSGES